MSGAGRPDGSCGAHATAQDVFRIKLHLARHSFHYMNRICLPLIMLTISDEYWYGSSVVRSYTQPAFWLIALVVPVAATVLDLAAAHYQQWHRPTPSDVLLENEIAKQAPLKASRSFLSSKRKVQPAKSAADSPTLDPAVIVNVLGRLNRCVRRREGHAEVLRSGLLLSPHHTHAAASKLTQWSPIGLVVVTFCPYHPPPTLQFSQAHLCEQEALRRNYPRP